MTITVTRFKLRCRTKSAYKSNVMPQATYDLLIFNNIFPLTQIKASQPYQVSVYSSFVVC